MVLKDLQLVADLRLIMNALCGASEWPVIPTRSGSATVWRVVERGRPMGAAASDVDNSTRSFWMTVRTITPDASRAAFIEFLFHVFISGKWEVCFEKSWIRLLYRSQNVRCSLFTKISRHKVPFVCRSSLCRPLWGCACPKWTNHVLITSVYVFADTLCIS